METGAAASRAGDERVTLGVPAGALVLVVDDDPFIARLLEIELHAAGYLVRVASDGGEALEAARERCPDLVLADVMMPNMDGLELTRHLREDPNTAAACVILLTARGLSADKLEGLSAGADDYIVKPFDTPELLARVRGALRRSKDMRAQSPLTGLPGNVQIQEEIQARVEAGREFAVLYADLDQFKAFNDHYGFARGDEVLRLTAGLIQEVALDEGGPEAFTGHVGGDDFVVVSSTETAPRIAVRIVEGFDEKAWGLYDPRDAARGHIEVKNRGGDVERFPILSISVGVATTERRRFSHFAEAVAIATEMKSFTKGTAGSSWAIDRRSR
ncbi:MAG: GGDEF domain-containing response regulator [Actinomycetota bacterium]